MSEVEVRSCRGVVSCLQGGKPALEGPGTHLGLCAGDPRGRGSTSAGLGFLGGPEEGTKQRVALPWASVVISTLRLSLRSQAGRRLGVVKGSGACR